MTIVFGQPTEQQIIDRIMRHDGVDRETAAELRDIIRQQADAGERDWIEYAVEVLTDAKQRGMRVQDVLYAGS